MPELDQSDPVFGWNYLLDHNVIQENKNFKGHLEKNKFQNSDEDDSNNLNSNFDDFPMKSDIDISKIRRTEISANSNPLPPGEEFMRWANPFSGSRLQHSTSIRKESDVQAGQHLGI